MDLGERVVEACAALGRICEDPDQSRTGKSVTADEGYFDVEEVCLLQAERLRTIIGDPHAPKRKREGQCAQTRKTLHKAKRAVTSKSGKALLRKRGEHLERSFCHVLDQGGMRRATLRGCGNLTKRLIGAVIGFNLSLLMRHLHGIGTPKQWEASSSRVLEVVVAVLQGLRNAIWAHLAPPHRQLAISSPRIPIAAWMQYCDDEARIRNNSTGC